MKMGIFGTNVMESFSRKESWCFTRKKILQSILDEIQRLIAAVGRHRVIQHFLGLAWKILVEDFLQHFVKNIQNTL